METTDKPKKMTEEQLLSIVNSEFDNAQGTPDGEIANERTKLWDHYLSKPLGNEVEGHSKVVTADVAEVVDSTMPSLIRMFTTAENLVQFDPVIYPGESPQEAELDERRAEQETDYISHCFFKKNPAFELLYTWFFDALAKKNGIVKAFWDTSKKISRETYRGLTDEEYDELLQDEELEVEEEEERQELGMVDVLTVMGYMPQEAEITVHDVVFKRTRKKGRITIVNVPPDEYRISGDSRSIDPCKARMVGQESDITRAELVEMGFDKDLVWSLPAIPESDKSKIEKAKTHDKADELRDAKTDKSLEKVRVREAYIRTDFDGDGYPELRKVISCDKKVLDNEETDRQPYHVLSPQPLPHKHFGRALSEKVVDVQMVTTTLLRQMLDNLYQTNNPKTYIYEMAIGDDTLSDMLSNRPGQVVRGLRPASEAYGQLDVPFTAGQTFPMLEHFDKLKRDRTGISSDAQGLSPDALKNIQIGVLSNALDVSRLKTELIARIFAETGIKSLFLHMHELALKYQDTEDVVKLRGNWVAVDPQEWRERDDMTVKIGLGIGTREQNMLHLEAIWAKQVACASEPINGMNLLVTPRHFHKTAMEFVKNANLPGEFFADPGDQMAPPPSDEQMALQQQQQELVKRQQELDGQDLQLKLLKQKLDQQKDLMDERLKRIELMMTHQIEREKNEIARRSVDDDLRVALRNISVKLYEIDKKYAGGNSDGSRKNAGRDSPRA